MIIDPALLEFCDGYTAYCGAKCFGGDREHVRAEVHEWEPPEENGYVFCCQCGAYAYVDLELWRPRSVSVQ